MRCRSSSPPSRARLKASNILLNDAWTHLPPIVPLAFDGFRPRKALPDISWTSLLALKESADAFPPLKAAVGAVIAICDIAERTRRSRYDARAIALQVIKIMEVIADAVPDGSDISPPMLDSISEFSCLLREIAYVLKDIFGASSMSRFVNLNSNERLLKDIKRQLDDAYRDFLAASTLRLEVQQTQLASRQMQFAVQQEQFAIQQKQFAVQQAQSHVELQKVSFATARLLFYSRLITFFGRPLRLPYKSHPHPLRPDTQPMLAGQRARGHIRPIHLFFRLCMEPESLRPQGWRLSLYSNEILNAETH